MATYDRRQPQKGQKDEDGGFRIYEWKPPFVWEFVLGIAGLYLAHVAALQTVQHWDVIAAWLGIAAGDTVRTIAWVAEHAASDALATPNF